MKIKGLRGRINRVFTNGRHRRRHGGLGPQPAMCAGCGGQTAGAPRLSPRAALAAAAVVLLAACDDLGTSLGQFSRTITNKGTAFDVTYSEGKVREQIRVAGGKTVEASFDATFIEIRRSNGVAMKPTERKRALEIGTTFCDINRVPRAPAPGLAEFDGTGWRLTNHCGGIFR